MDLMAISQVSKTFHVSARALRYYEQLGILQSQKKEDYAYRVYDEDAVRRLQQIIILRKLRIPLKQIGEIFRDGNAAHIVEVFTQNVEELNDEITVLTTIRSVLRTLIARLQDSIARDTKTDVLCDRNIMKVIESLNLSTLNMKEERSMKEINKVFNALTKLNDVRIIHLPPCTVASCRKVCTNPEEAVGEVLEKFVKESNLYAVKPDARVFGFNHPNPTTANPQHGYEIWVTIPDDMDIAPPMVKKKFPGGLYAAHKIAMGDFHEWDWLREWMKTSSKYDSDYSTQGSENMFGCLEEHINWVYCSSLHWPKDHESQLDLLLPIRLK